MFCSVPSCVYSPSPLLPGLFLLPKRNNKNYVIRISDVLLCVCADT
jgi:hypothetical protein